MTGESDEPAALLDLERLLPDRAYVFVVGPGVGESVLVALPNSGWVVIDACRIAGTVPAIMIFERWRRDTNDKVELAILTHPHTDHAEGFPDILARLEPGRVGVAGGKHPGRNLYREAAALVAEEVSAPTSRELLQASVRAAIAAIRTWEGDERSVTALHDGLELRLGSAVLRCRAPTAQDIDAFFAERDTRRLAAKLRSSANHISTVIEIAVENARLLFCADLPTTASSQGAPPIRGGWDDVAARHGNLADHALLKIAHHGSTYAFAPAVLNASGKPRAWACTPYDRSSLPTPEAARMLLANESRLHLTALPADWLPRELSGGSFAASQVYRSARATNDPLFAKARTIRVRRSPEPLGPVWAFEIDPVRGTHRTWKGNLACLVTR